MEELIALIRGRINHGVPVSPSTPLISSGLIDSFTIASLLAAFQDRYGVTIDPADIGVDNFDTPAHMLEFIRAHQ